MTYAEAVQFAQSWGLVLLCALFAAAVAYALWPANKDRFRRAASAPLRED
jgi:cytochrome c oxidase cbb3-type subunit 4